MGISAGPDMIQNGLVLALDAADRNSYISGSTTWTDMSGNGNNGTLTNGPTFSSDNGGSIVFDGTNDYVDNIGTVSTFSFIQNTGIYTISAWIRIASLINPSYYLGNNDGTGAQKGFGLGYSGALNEIWLFVTNGSTAILNHKASNFFTLNSWIHTTCVGNGTSNQFYQNGVTFSSTLNFGTFSTGVSTRTLALGRYNNSPLTDNWNGNIANVQIYNRALSVSEILQNYNATKTRFGL